MGELSSYKIPIIGLSDGLSIHTFFPDSEFFQTYDNDLLSKGQFEVKLTMDKQNNMFILHFDINGSIPTECDRCTADINLPISSEYQLIVKLDNEASGDIDIEHIPVDTLHMDIANYLYDFMVMSLPLVKTYDCEKEDPKPCNLKALETLNTHNEKGDSGIWDDLKNIHLNK